MKEFTKEELTRYNGRNGAPAYIAYKGKVYDVSDSLLWKNGSHQVLHNAGADLTESIEQAPHSADVLKKFSVVGVLRDEEQNRRKLIFRKNIQNLKPHRRNRL